MSEPSQPVAPSPYFLDLLDVDFKAEILAASLANQQITPERIVINPTGLYSRAYSKDIEELSDWLLEGSTFIYNRIDTPREGLLDMLPPYLFFKPVDPSGSNNVDQILDDLRQNREEERQNRLFFLPFDSELNYLRSLTVHYDNAVDHLDSATDIINQFADHWPILTHMTRTQAGIFIQIIPWLHLLRSNLPWFSRFLQLFFDVPVQVEAGRRLPKSTRSENLPTLSACRLGVDAVVGDRFDDGRNGVQITVGPVPDDRIADFLPHSQFITLLHNLVDYFLPISNEVSIAVQAEPLPVEAAPTATFLGYNSFL